MKKYSEVKIEMISLSVTDVITASTDYGAFMSWNYDTEEDD